MRLEYANLHCSLKHCYAAVINFIEVKQKIQKLIKDYENDQDRLIVLEKLLEQYNKVESIFDKITTIIESMYFKNKEVTVTEISKLVTALRIIRSKLENIINSIIKLCSISENDELIENAILEDFRFLYGNIANVEMHLNYIFSDENEE